jgi:hypothetical protein
MQDVDGAAFALAQISVMLLQPLACIINLR